MRSKTQVLVGMVAAIGAVNLLITISQRAEAQAPKVKPAASITPVQAMQAAEAKFGGKAGMAVFEFDEGHWVYGVVVAKNHKLLEVDVDPVTGKVGDSEAASPADEAKELKEALTRMAK